MACRTIIYFITIFSFLTIQAYGQVTTQTHASGLTNPIGLTIDGAGNLWVAEQGTGNDDSQISIITPGGIVHSLMTGTELE